MGMGIRGGGAARQVRALLDQGATGSLGDGELLGRFLGRADSAEAAFAALVDRHGRMVLRVCLDVLGDSHDAQDAAQATFFILARKAAAIRKPEALPAWLHGTARRVASRALRESIRRRRHERRCAEVSSNRSADGRLGGWPELHEELARLPDRYREPIVLCDLWGLTHEQAAGKLGCPARTLETRLYRGRERLKNRLVRRGVALSTAAVGMTWAREAQALPPAWVASTASAGRRLAMGVAWAAAGDLPVNSVRWARKHLKETAMLKLKLILGSGVLLGLAWQEVRSQGPPPKGPSQANPEAPRMNPRPALEPPAPETYTHPITVTGRALDLEGRPIAGARIYMASLRADYKRAGETSTDAEGRYEFRKVELPIERAKTLGGRDCGWFQVFGEAKGLGFAFRPIKKFFPLPRPADVPDWTDPTDPPGRYEAGEEIAVDLSFPAAARLTGTIVDDRGKPLPDVRLEIRSCESLAPAIIRPGWTLYALNEEHSAPVSMKFRTTDHLGRFDFEGMPSDCRFWIVIRAEGFPSRYLHAATTSGPQPSHQGVPVLTGDIKVTMPIARDVPIWMVFADTLKPAVGTLVQAGGREVGDSKSTDDRGRAILRLPKGTFQMESWPARGTPYLVTEADLEVGDQPSTSPFVSTLRRAAEIEVEVVDRATGAGLPEVDLWHLPEGGEREKFVVKSFEAEGRLFRRDNPRTDARGRMHALAEPGKHRFGVGLEAYPEGYELVEAEGLEVECRAGETVNLKFTMRRRER